MAVVLVVAYHSVAPTSGGFVGVDVFFVVSGFVISLMLVRELEQTGTLSFRRFYARRVKRLLPALALVLLVVAVASPFVQTPLGSMQRVVATGLATVALSANAELFVNSGGYFDAAVATNPLLHMWTLAVEEQFYVVFPAVLLLAWLCAGKLGLPARRVAFCAVAAVLAGSLVLSVLLTFGEGLPFGAEPINRRFAFYGSPTRAWEFAFGGLVALCDPSIRRWLRPTAALILSAAGAAGMLLSVALLSDTTAFPGYAALLPVLSTCALVVGGVPHSSPITRLLSSRPFTWVGDQSYSWYLWHWPLVVSCRAAIPGVPLWALGLVAASGLPLAWVTGRWIENPLRRNPSLAGRRVVGLAVGCCLAPAVAFGGLALFSSHPPASIRALAEQNRSHLDKTRACIKNVPGTNQTRHCTWTPPGAQRSVLLVGDSNAGQFAEPVLRAAEAKGMAFTLATFGGCPFAPLSTIYEDDPRDPAACDGFVGTWSAEISRSRPSVVVVASATPNYIESDSITFVGRGGRAVPATSPEAKAEQWRRAMEEMLGGWADQGVRTVVVHTVPQFGPFDLSQCPARAVYRDVGQCAEDAPVAQLASHRARALAAEKAAAAATPGTLTLDLFGEICPAAPTCSTFRGGRFLYRDGAHLSVPYAESLSPKFDEVLTRALLAPSARA